MRDFNGFRFNDARQALFDLAAIVTSNGEKVAPRGQQTREMRHVTIQIDDTSDCLALGMGRRFNSRLAAVEVLSLLSGVVSEELLVAASPGYLNFVGGSVTGAYGPRIADQMPYVIDALRHDPDSRQAVVTIWSPEQDLFKEHGDRPCTTQIGFLIRDGKLITNTMMRSQDVYLGFTYDVVMFTQLHQTVAAVLGVEPGHLVHQVRSLHVYERDLPKVFQLEPPEKEPTQRLRGLAAASWPDVAERAAYLFLSDAVGVDPDEPFTDTERWLATFAKIARDKALTRSSKTRS